MTTKPTEPTPARRPNWRTRVERGDYQGRSQILIIAEKRAQDGGWNECSRFGVPMYRVPRLLADIAQALAADTEERLARLFAPHQTERTDQS